MRFLHAADLHLDSPPVGVALQPDTSCEQLRGTTRRALEQLVGLAIAEEVAFVCLAGDVYDRAWRDYQTGLYFVRQMSRLQQHGIPVFLVHGNHDAWGDLTRNLPLPANVHVFGATEPESVVREDLGVALHGQSFDRRVEGRNLAQGYPAALPGLLNVGLLHTSLNGREGHDPYAPCNLEDLRARGYDYWALGHAHSFEVVDRAPWVVFSGCLQGRNVRETGPKGAVLVTVEGTAVTNVEFRPLDVLRWAECSVDATAAAHLSEVLDRARPALTECLAAGDGRPLAVRIRVHGPTGAHHALSADPEDVTQQLRAIALEVHPEDLWVERVLLATRTAALPDAARPAEGLLDTVRTVETAALGDCLTELRALWAKLPPELHEDVGPAPDLAALGAWRQEAEDLLVGRLLGDAEGV